MPDGEFTQQERARVILEALAETSQATTTELATALEAHPITVERHCRALQRAGHVRRCPGGAYALVETDLGSSAPTPDDAAVGQQRSTNPAD
ncbi:transcriptional regulator, DeoR family [Haloterrigena turkmenica DSM 5511]|uniref:Transcriptional regulator, DeoR family n=1 Tax=Haloterrigena turkmenica (strain ATCC 51198 / DSM 5511 / JCM 9101 / NCIMB 13204 / VKM B-1734 / 4k) TaxID=543526 RepID=D2RWK3_HALTV|nr:helix-turn-helix domain-containing protein [Haloterrigena turkmenica]ADB61504.1 transcriptional regulator, DeoR family [Haloterrigena turkmenica DSM 5511]